MELPNHPRFFESDPDHQDLGSGELATKRYLRLINSADYRPNPLMSVSGDRASEDLPPNLLTEGRRLTPANNSFSSSISPRSETRGARNDNPKARNRRGFCEF